MWKYIAFPRQTYYVYLAILIVCPICLSLLLPFVSFLPSKFIHCCSLHCFINIQLKVVTPLIYLSVSLIFFLKNHLYLCLLVLVSSIFFICGLKFLSLVYLIELLKWWTDISGCRLLQCYLKKPFLLSGNPLMQERLVSKVKMCFMTFLGVKILLLNPSLIGVACYVWELSMTWGMFQV